MGTCGRRLCASAPWMIGVQGWRPCAADPWMRGRARLEAMRDWSLCTVSKFEVLAVRHFRR